MRYVNLIIVLFRHPQSDDKSPKNDSEDVEAMGLAIGPGS